MHIIYIEIDSLIQFNQFVEINQGFYLKLFVRPYRTLARGFVSVSRDFRPGLQMVRACRHFFTANFTGKSWFKIIKMYGSVFFL